MGARSRLIEMRSKYVAEPKRERPFFIADPQWAVFSAFVWEGKEIDQIASEQDLPPKVVRRMLTDVERHLSVPRATDHEWTRLTINSPIEDLHLSVRALNQLRDLGCNTVEDILRIDLSKSRIGERSREEVLQQLREHGLAVAAENGGDKADLDRVTAQLVSLKQQIDESMRLWKNRVDRIEAKLRRLGA